MNEKEFILFVSGTGQVLIEGYGYLKRMADEGILKVGSVEKAYFGEEGITAAFKDEETKGQVRRLLERGGINEHPNSIAFRAEVLNSLRLEEAAKQFCKMYAPADCVVYKAVTE